MSLNFRSVVCSCSAILLLLVFVANDTGQLHAASSLPTWLDSSTEPSVSYGTNLSLAAFDEFRNEQGILPSTLSGCTTKTIPVNQYGGTDTSCWADTSIGLIGENGYMFRPKGNDMAGCLNGCSTRLMPTPNPDVFFELVDEDGGTAHIALRTPETSQVTQTLPDPDHSDDASTLTWDSLPAYQPVDANGSVIAVDDNALYTSATVSQNGKWMLLWNPAGSFTRVNLTSFQALSVSLPPSDIEPNLFAEVDVSDSGRYVAIASIPSGGNRLRVFDLNACNGNVTSLMVEPITCGSRDLSVALQDKNLYTFRLPVFYGDDLLSIHARDDYDGSYNSYFLQAPNTTHSSNYIGLGDSYSSGEGTFSYLSGTDEKDNKCHLSTLTYAYLLAANLKLNSVHSVACSGAKIDDALSNAQHPVKPKNAFSSYWLPGYQSQLQYTQDRKPDVLTVTMGGNDIGFGSILKRCLMADSCFNTYEERKGLVEDIDGEFTHLRTLYNTLKYEVTPGGHIYVIGYPQIVLADGDCGVNVRLDKSETEFANGLISYINDVIRQTAAAAGVSYVDIENAFGNHRLCGSDTPPFAVNGLTAGNDNVIIGNESYHPTVYGYQLIADAIGKATNNFTLPMPSPDRTIELPDPLDALSFLDNVPKSGNMVRKQEFDDTASSYVVLLHGGSVQGDLDASEFSLQPDSSYEVWLHSSPIKLGTATTDSSGNLHYSFLVPTSTEVGLHSIDVLGTDSTGDPIDIQRTIYVAASANDWDGNGIPNTKEPCGVFTSSGVDKDKDGIDDACDPVIGNQPLITQGPSSPSSTTQIQTPTVSSLLNSNLSSQTSASISLDSPTQQPSQSGNSGTRKRMPGSNSKKVWTTALVLIMVVCSIAEIAYVKRRKNKKR